MPEQIPLVGTAAISTISEDLGGSAKRKREGSASYLASLIVWSFCIAVGWLLCESAYLLYKVTENLPAVSGAGTASSPTKTLEFVSEAILPFFKEAASTVTSIFGSTLGFVLGYYFKNDSK